MAMLKKPSTLPLYLRTQTVLISLKQKLYFRIGIEIGTRTPDRMVGIDSQTGKELLNVEHKMKFNQIVMVEWALGANATRWESELKSAAAQAPASLCPADHSK